MPYWHIDSFELKLLKKWPVQEGHSDPPLCLPESTEDISHVKGALPASESRRTPFWPERGNVGQETLLLLSFTTPKPNSVQILP